MPSRAALSLEAQQSTDGYAVPSFFQDTTLLARSSGRPRFHGGLCGRSGRCKCAHSKHVSAPPPAPLKAARYHGQSQTTVENVEKGEQVGQTGAAMDAPNVKNVGICILQLRSISMRARGTQSSNFVEHLCWSDMSRSWNMPRSCGVDVAPKMPRESEVVPWSGQENPGLNVAWEMESPSGQTNSRRFSCKALLFEGIQFL
jgi:hypothetical protein